MLIEMSRKTSLFCSIQVKTIKEREVHAILFFSYYIIYDNINLVYYSVYKGKRSHNASTRSLALDKS